MPPAWGLPPPPLRGSPLDPTASRGPLQKERAGSHFADHPFPVHPLRPGGIRLSMFPPKASTAESGAQG
jgi:hypothetical protein